MKKFLIFLLVVALSNVASASVVGYWEFNEGNIGGVVMGSTDLTANNNDIVTLSFHSQATYRAGDPSHSDGKSAELGRLSFSEGAVFRVPASSVFDTTSFTIEMLIMVESDNPGWQDYQNLFSKNNNISGTANEYMGVQDRADGTTRTGGFIMPSWSFGSNATNDGQWHHIALVKDGTTMNFYWDRVLDYTDTADAGIVAAGAYLGFGGNINTDGTVKDYESSAWFDYIRISDTALTPDGFLPEPATICLLGLGALALLRKKR